jgi:DNA modification methylase
MALPGDLCHYPAVANRLYYGDNLDVLREHLPDGSVDLIYLDPPFNSNRAYNVIFAPSDRVRDSNLAQIQAFDDTWRWTPATDEQYRDILSGSVPPRVADVLRSLHALLGENDAMAYLVNMAPRLGELHRVLKPTGSLYLHCDPTMSHYLKIVLDAIFGAENFRNEITWERSGAKNDSLRFGRSHDVLLFYTRSNRFTWNVEHTPFRDASILKNYTHVEEGTGRRYRRGDLTAAKPGGDVDYEWHGVRPYRGRYWAYSRENMDKMLAEGRIEFRRTGMPTYKRYLDEQPGVPLQDVWTDIRLTSADKERLGYPTQKPVALLERIIRCSSNPGDVVLDPFCGCGTTIDAAQRLSRTWIGIDITYIAVDLIMKRLEHAYGESIRGEYQVSGIPRDLAGARSLFDRSPFDFERWAVSLVRGTPNQKQVGDRGIDGVVRFYTDTRGDTGRILVSVKGGKSLGPQFARDLIGTVTTERAEMGSLLTLAPPTRGIYDAVAHAGTYRWPVNGAIFPRAQVLTVEELLTGKRLQAPPAILRPYIQAGRHKISIDQLTLL